MNKSNHDPLNNAPNIHFSHQVLAFIIFITSVTSAIILSFMPLGLFLVFSAAACLAWCFHRNLFSFLGSLKAEQGRNIYPSTDEQIINFKQLKSIHKNSSLRALYGKAANNSVLEDNNIIDFPHSSPSNHQ
ncbi:MAG: hypothetical protein KUG83_01900 [Gammaproteobacteria bacterium]|nr:hypothetical protein [Gammaproteobacteria bacterium]